MWFRSSPSSLTNERNNWSTRIDQVGSERAYQEFKVAYQGKNFHEQHIGAHILGELLYRKAGVTGVTTCDDSFGFGCFHTFFLQAVIEHGLDVTGSLSQVCVNKYGDQAIGCLPGIGHGLIEYLGPDKLDQALNYCLKTAQINPRLGCATGVFTGYNFPSMTDAVGYFSRPRAFTENQAYSPCTAVATPFLAGCYLGLPQWWNVALQHDYIKMGRLCQAAPATYQSDCFLGIGRVASPTAEFKVTGVKERCQAMPGEAEIATCRAGASGVFQSVVNRPQEADQLCADLDEVGRKICAGKSRLLVGRGV